MKKFEEIAQSLIEKIKTGVYQERLPGCHSLADEFCVNFKTANRAITHLVEHQYAYRKRGEGAYVLEKKKVFKIALGFYKYMDQFNDPVFSSLVLSINDKISGTGHKLDIISLKMHDDPTRRKTSHEYNRKMFMKRLEADKPDGVILLGALDKEIVESINAEFPMVVVEQKGFGFGTKADIVRRDVASGVEKAVDFLADQGHKNIIFLTYEEVGYVFDLLEKKRGYMSGVKKHGLTPQVLTIKKRKDILSELNKIKHKATAVIAAESTLAIPVFQEMYTGNRTSADTMKVIAFDDGNLGELVFPRISSIHAFGVELGELAVVTLIERLKGKLKESVERVLPCKIIER